MPIKAKIKRILPEIKRILPDLISFCVLFIAYLTGFYRRFDPPVQLVSLKMLLVSMGFVHCHIIRKIAFGRVNWDEKSFTPKKLLIIVLYAVFIYAYAQGG